MTILVYGIEKSYNSAGSRPVSTEQCWFAFLPHMLFMILRVLMVLE